MDKILTEAFDKLKAIEESDDPFCIGQLSENEDEEEEIVEESGDYNYDENGNCLTCAGEGTTGDGERCENCDGYGYDRSGPDSDEEGPHADEDKTYEVEDQSGNHYGVYFQGEGRGDPNVFIEANGITVAHFAVGGAGPMNAKIVKPEELLDAIVAFATQGR